MHANGAISHKCLKKPAPSRVAGFSLVELMVTVGLLSILAAIGTGFMVQNLPNYRLRGAARDLVSNFQKAKIEAAKRNTRVILIFTYGAGASGKYQICTDRNNDNDCDEADEEQLLEIEMPQEVTLYNTGATPFGAGKPDNVTGFTSRGFPVTMGSVMLKNDLSRYYKLSISMAGFVKLYTSSDGSTWN